MAHFSQQELDEYIAKMRQEGEENLKKEMPENFSGIVPNYGSDSMTSSINKYNAHKHDQYLKSLAARDQLMQGWRKAATEKQHADTDRMRAINEQQRSYSQLALQRMQAEKEDQARAAQLAQSGIIAQRQHELGIRGLATQERGQDFSREAQRQQHQVSLSGLENTRMANVADANIRRQQLRQSYEAQQQQHQISAEQLQLQGELGRGDLAEKIQQRGLQTELGRGDLAERRQQRELQGELGRGELGEKAESRRLQGELGRGELGEKREQRRLQGELGRGELAEKRNQLQLQRELGEDRSQLELLRIGQQQREAAIAAEQHRQNLEQRQIESEQNYRQGIASNLIRKQEGDRTHSINLATAGLRARELAQSEAQAGDTNVYRLAQLRQNENQEATRAKAKIADQNLIRERFEMDKKQTLINNIMQQRQALTNLDFGVKDRNQAKWVDQTNLNLNALRLQLDQNKIEAFQKAHPNLSGNMSTEQALNMLANIVDRTDANDRADRGQAMDAAQRQAANRRYLNELDVNQRNFAVGVAQNLASMFLFR